MKDLVTPLGLTAIGAESTARQNRAQFYDWPVGGISLVALAGARFCFRLPVAPESQSQEIT